MKIVFNKIAIPLILSFLFQISVFADSQTLYSCNFENATDIAKWTASGTGTWSIVDAGNGNHIYDVTSGGGNGESILLANEIDDIADGWISADIQIKGAGSNGSTGILFRYIDPTHAYMLRLNYAGGSLQFMKINGGTWSVIHSETGLALELNTTYNVKIRAEGSSFKCYLDGDEKFELTDSDISDGGKIGFRVWQQRSAIDNVLVESLLTTEWELVWSDEFDYVGLPDSRKWGYEEGYVRNKEEQYYTKARLENAFVQDGMLNIKCIKENYPNKDYQNAVLAARSGEAWKTVDEYAKYTSACLTTYGKASWTYGKFEIRAKFPTGAGCWPAFWMMGINIYSVGWPKCGEIDIFEWVGRAPNKLMGGLHYKNPVNDSNAKTQGSTTITNASSDFHIYTLEWDEEKIKFKFDDVVFHSFDTKNAGDIFTRPHYMLLNYALGGAMGLNIDESVLPQTYLIDYVRVYRIKPEELSSNTTNESMCANSNIDVIYNNSTRELTFLSDNLISKVEVYNASGLLVYKAENGRAISANTWEKGAHIVKASTVQKNIVTKILIL